MADQAKQQQRGQKRKQDDNAGKKKGPAAPGSSSNATATPKKENAKQRRTAKQVMDVQPVQNVDGPARVVKVEEFVKARQYEIQAMESALKNATEFTGNMRVFQTLPRHMRRRAASYNVKRLPQKYRQRAIDQISNAKEKPQPIKKSRRAKRRPGQIFELFAKRSKDDKRWLDTHLWHAKRFHMEHKWGFMLGMHPNDKSTRASFRASQHASIVHDASYQICLELRGPSADICRVMATIVDPTCMAVGAKRYIDGAKQGSTFVHRKGAFPGGCVAPVTFFWVNGVVGEGEKVLWVWVHPAAAGEVEEVLKAAVSEEAVSESVTVTSLKSQLSRFEMTGPRSNAILHEVFKLNPECAVSQDAHRTWALLDHVRTSASLPAGVIMGLSIQDPRLTFPPKMKPRPTGLPSHEIQNSLTALLTSWPKIVSQTTLHIPESRATHLHLSPTEHQLNAERAKNPLPGMPLAPSAGSLPVSILLIQRNTVGATEKTGEFVNGWDVIVPAGQAAVCVWKSLVFAGSHAVGVEDRRRCCFEGGCASFPEDYPETGAHVLWAKEEREKKVQEWGRKPVAKRMNYEKVKVADPFLSHYAKVVGAGGGEGGVDPAVVQVVHGSRLVGVVKQGVAKGDGLAEMTQQCLQTIESVRPGYTCASGYSLDKAFVRVRLTMVGRGMVAEHGMVYLASDKQVAFWTEHLKRGKERDLVDEFDWLKTPEVDAEEEIEKVLDQFPAVEQVIGYVSHGGFSLADGQGSAMACCSVKGLVEARKRVNEKGRSFVLVRGPKGRVCRPAQFEILH
ncbi:hypothetical protein HDU98_008032 [Podochytrium sp. JEL0797]|nr:hypothetical protein HDU98_008032 [Podochytrium sp. JEL0797]